MRTMRDIGRFKNRRPFSSCTAVIRNWSRRGVITRADAETRKARLAGMRHAFAL